MMPLSMVNEGEPQVIKKSAVKKKPVNSLKILGLYRELQ